MKWIIGTLTVAVVAALAIGLSLFWTGSESTPVSDAEVLASVTTTEGNGLSEGVTIHGDWVIEVQNPDGTLAEHREFSNAFMGPGKKIISDLLLSQKVAGRWSVHIKGTLPDGSNAPCGPGSGVGNGETCDIRQAWDDDSKNPSGIYGPLSVSTVGYPDHGVKLAGSVVATRISVITHIRTYLGMCPSNIPADACSDYDDKSNTGNKTFTEKILMPGTDAISVEPGQKIDFTISMKIN